MESQRVWTPFRATVLVGVTVAVVFGTASAAVAQALKDVQTPDTPLVLKAQGSFFVGGEKVEQQQGELGNLGPGGHIAVNQMYVRFMVPQGGTASSRRAPWTSSRSRQCPTSASAVSPHRIQR